MSSSSPPPATAPAPTSPPSATTPTSPPPPKSPLPTPPVPSPTSPPTPTSPAPTSPPPTSPPPSTPPPSKPVTPPPKPVAPPTPPPPPASSPPPSPAASSPPPSSSGSSPPPPATPSTSSPPPPSSPSRRSPPSSPSPPPPSRKSPPSSSASPPPPPSSSNSISTPLVVGIAVGAVVVLVLLSVLCICCRRKKRRTQGPLDYYGGPPPPQKDDASGGWQHIAPPPADHVVQIPPQPPPPPPFASRPPPRPMISSSGGSGSNYSGSENPLPPPSPGIALSFSKSTFTFEELAKATDGFSDANLLGQGGFGYVHRGVLLNGKEVAIKQLKSGSGQGEREFQAEVEIISRVHHRHLVSLVGYCISGGQRLLVYDLAPNYTLEFHLHGKDRPTMDWPTRLKIALGSAKGLAYLHEDCRPKIIHRDIKASNILLDYEFEAKVADFGLAKFAYDNNTHISTRVMGTFGYMAPEYASTGKLTDKSDVFSFGVMLLELITGRRPVDSTQAFNESLVDWARPLLTRALEDDNYDALVDPRLEYYNPNERARMVACAAACVRHSARHRPRMSQIVRALEGDVSLDDLNEGVRPGHSTRYGSYGSSEYDSGQYNQDMKKFRKMALQSQDFASSESSAPTSDYGQNPSASSSEGQQTREMEMGKMKTDSQGFSSSPRNLTSD